MSGIILAEKAKTLASYAADLEALCVEVDEADGQISDDLCKRFDDAKLALSEKTDRWIGYLDVLESQIGLLKKQKERLTKAQKTREALQKRLKEYVRYVMTTTPNLPYKGESGSLSLRKNPPKLEVAFALPYKTFYNIIDKTLLELQPSIAGYLKFESVHVLDTDTLRADLKSGMQLPWAKLVQEQRVEVKG